MRLLCVLGASEALADHLVRHPEHWRELTDPVLGSTRPAACADARALLAAVGADAARPDAGGDRCRTPRRSTRCGWSTGGCCCGSPPATWPTTSASTTRPPSCPTSPPARSRRRSRSPGAGRRRRRAGPAGRDRDGQVRRPRAQLRLRRRRDLRPPPVEGAGRERRAARRDPARQPPDAGLLRPHGEGTIWPVDAALRPEGKAGPLVRTLASHRGYYERWAKTWEFQALLKARPVAGDLDAGPGVRRDGRADGVVGGRARRASSRTSRRCAGGWSSTSRPREAERQLKLGSGGLRDVEFAVQLLQLVHGRADERIRGRHDAERAGRADPRRVRRPRGRRGAARGLRLPAHARAPDPAAPAAAYPRRARRRGVAAPARPQHGLPQGPGRRPRQGLAAPPARGAPAAREALLPAAAGGGRADPRRRGAAVARGGRASGWPRSASPTRRPRCATSRR